MDDKNPSARLEASASAPILSTQAGVGHAHEEQAKKACERCALYVATGVSRRVVRTPAE